MAQDNQNLSRLPQRERTSFVARTLALLFVFSGGMLLVAMPHLVSGSPLMVGIKSALIAGAAATGGYFINRLALENGTKLAAIGYSSAAFVSLLAIIVVGFGLWTATFFGLVFSDVELRRLESHGPALGNYTSKELKRANQAGRIGAALNAGATDLAEKAACEIGSSCISGRGNGGNGPVARIVAEKAGRAAIIAAQFGSGIEDQRAVQAEVSGLLADYNAIAADGELDLPERRVALAGIDAKIRRAVSDLSEAAPVQLASAYASELEAGVNVPTRAEATRRLSMILRQHGQSLRAVLASIETAPAEAPTFPRKTGVFDALGYIPDYLPVAVVTFIADLGAPLFLWALTFYARAWGHVRTDPPRPRTVAEDEGFESLRLPPPAAPAPKSAERSSRKRRGRKPSGLNGANDPHHTEGDA